MTSPVFLTWDGDPDSNISPYRPGTEDVGNDTLVNDPADPPDEETMPGAPGWNQRAKQIAALSRVVPAGGVSVAFSGGVPFILKQTFASSSAPAGLTVVNIGPGNNHITWDADQFPVAALEPHGATINSNSTGLIRVQPFTNGVQVITRSTSALTNLDFTVCFG
jgi:hypothetical protein